MSVLFALEQTALTNLGEPHPDKFFLVQLALILEGFSKTFLNVLPPLARDRLNWSESDSVHTRVGQTCSHWLSLLTNRFSFLK